MLGGAAGWDGGAQSCLLHGAAHDNASESSPRKYPGVQKDPSCCSTVFGVWLGRVCSAEAKGLPQFHLSPPPTIKPGLHFSCSEESLVPASEQTGKLHGPNTAVLACDAQCCRAPRQAPGCSLAGTGSSRLLPDQRWLMPVTPARVVPDGWLRFLGTHHSRAPALHWQLPHE